MYWPCGIPRIYAYQGSKDLEANPGDSDEHGETSQSSNEVDEEATQADRNHPSQPEGESDTRISDLRVARLDHIFVTISPSCLTVWSSRVCLPIRVVLELSQLTHTAYHRLSHGGTLQIKITNATVGRRCDFIA